MEKQQKIKLEDFQINKFWEIQGGWSAIPMIMLSFFVPSNLIS